MRPNIGIDVGGTKIAAGVVDECGGLIAKSTRETPADDAEAIIDGIVELVDELRQSHDVGAVGIGAAGFVDADRSTVLLTPNIDWRNEPVGRRVSGRTGIPVIVENDAAAAAWGEFRFGAGTKADDLLMVAVGTGVGGGLVSAGSLFRGGFGVAAEIGHLRVVREGRACGCGQSGCFEQYASGRALVHKAMEHVQSTDTKADTLRRHAAEDMTRRNAAQVHGSVITKLAVSGDQLCIDMLADVGHWLGEGIASLVAVLDPTMVVIGGGVAEASSLLLGPAQAAFEEYLPARDHRPHPTLQLATLGNEAGLIGAADLARTP